MRSLITVESLNRLTTQIYAAALDWNRWPDVLNSVYSVSGGARSAIFGYDLQTNTPFNVIHSGFDPEFADSYFGYYGSLCPWPAAMGSVPVGVSVAAGSLIADNALVETEFYNDWVKPQDDIAMGGGVTLVRDATRQVVFTGNIRRRDADTMEADFLHLVGLLTPHLQQALSIGRLLAGRSLAETASLEADRGSAVLVLDGDGRIVFSNQRAESLIAVGAIMGRDLRGRLTLPLAVRAVFHELLEEMKGERIPLPRPITLGGPLAERWEGLIVALDPRGLNFSPFGMLCGVSNSCLLLTLAPRPIQTSHDKKLMQQFALTAAEADIALYLAEGLSLAEIAHARQVSIYTVRNQVKSALSKTGAHRQSELARLVERLRPGAAPRP